jgi:phosphonate transport system substrate-binding protein
MLAIATETINFANFLSPLLQETYASIVNYVVEHVGCTATLYKGQSLSEFASDMADVGFICGLQYVRMKGWQDCPVELLAAPVIEGKHYYGLPIYYSCVVVRVDRPYRSFDDLEGCVWGYNECDSHAGCNVVCSSLLERNKGSHYFGSVVRSGSHMNSLSMVVGGEVDAAAIDSHVFEVALRRNPTLAEHVHYIDLLGPSTIPPVVVAKRLDTVLKEQLRNALITMHDDDYMADRLHEGLIERFVPITDKQYDDIRMMQKRTKSAIFPFV